MSNQFIVLTYDIHTHIIQGYSVKNIANNCTLLKCHDICTIISNINNNNYAFKMCIHLFILIIMFLYYTILIKTESLLIKNNNNNLGLQMFPFT